MYDKRAYYKGIMFEEIPLTDNESRILHHATNKLFNTVQGKLNSLNKFIQENEAHFSPEEYQASMFIRDTFEDILATEIISPEHYDFVEWYFNNGELRTDREIKEYILQVNKQREELKYQAKMSKVAPFLGLLWMVITFGIVFILPGTLLCLPVLVKSGLQEYVMQAVFVNILIGIIACPVLIGIWGILCMACPFGNTQKVSAKGVVATTAASTAMHTRAMSNMGKTLFSEKKI